MGDLETTWKLFYTPGACVEVRALGISGGNKRWKGWAGGVVAGYFDDMQSFIDCVESLDEYGKAEAIYITLNPLNPDLLARANNRLVGIGKNDPTAKDEDVLQRRWLLVDIDPVRPTGISSNDDELAYALSVAEKIKATQMLAGWAVPVMAMSGNGIHLLWRVDMPNNEHYRNVVSATLKAISTKFSDERANVDIAVFNAARITKLYGTHARKGDETATRKHRQSKFMELPEPIQSIDLSLFDDVEIVLKDDSKPVYHEQTSLSVIESAMQALPSHFGSSGEGYNIWISCLMALHAEMGEAGIALCEKYIPGKPGEIASKFASFKRTDTGIGTLFHIAEKYGWQYPKELQEPTYDGFFYANGFDLVSAMNSKAQAEPKKPQLATVALKRQRYESEHSGDDDELPEDIDNYSSRVRRFFDSHLYRFSLNVLDDTIELNNEKLTDILESKISTQARDIGIKDKSPLRDVINMVAAENQYHPIRRYLEATKWDGEDHIRKLSEYVKDRHDPIRVGDSEAPVFRIWLAKWMIGAVAKIYEKGSIRAQSPMLVLSGAQALGKSTFVLWLCSGVHEYFVESDIKPELEDHKRLLASKWIWEVGELGATTRKADIESLKHFLTMADVTFRVPYGRYHITKSALASFIGTVNPDGSGFLADKTGNRRFLTVELESINHDYQKDIDIDQVWAQAFQMYRDGESWRLMDEEKAVQQSINEGNMKDDPVADWIIKYFNINPSNHIWRTTSQDITAVLQEKGMKEQSRALQMMVSQSLKAMGLQQDSNARPRQWKGIIAK